MMTNNFMEEMRLRRRLEVYVGNWRTVHLQGTCDALEVNALRQAIVTDDKLTNFHCLTGGMGLMGLPVWAAENIDVIGNLAERDYSINDVADALKELALAAPSLKLKAHVGGDYEDPTCIGTVTLAGGEVTQGEPEIPKIGEIPDSQVRANL